MSKKIIRAYWDCPFCESKKIDGLKDECPNCAKRKPADTKCYIDEDTSDDVLTEGELKAAGITAEECDGNHKEWACSYCGQLNNYADTFCNACGASKEEKSGEYGDFNKEDELEEKHKENVYAVYENYSFLNSSAETESDRYFKEKIDNIIAADKEPNSKGFSFRRVKNYFLPAALVSLVVFLFTFLLWPQEKVMEVTGFEWERNISVEEYQTFEESGWSLPSDARLDYSQEEFYGYTQVLDHYETKTRQVSRQEIDHYEDHTSYTDNGNGTFTEHTYQTPVYKTVYDTEVYEEPVYKDEPVYKTKYYYEIDRWVDIETYKSSGVDKCPYWNENYTLKDKQRDTDRTEKYYAIYSNEEETMPVNMGYSKWLNVNIGDKSVITTCRLGIIYGQDDNLSE